MTRIQWAKRIVLGVALVCSGALAVVFLSDTDAFPCAHVPDTKTEVCWRAALDTMRREQGLVAPLAHIREQFYEHDFVARNCLWSANELAVHLDELRETPVDRVSATEFLPRAVYNCYFGVGQALVNEHTENAAIAEVVIPREAQHRFLDSCVHVAPNHRSALECIEGVFSRLLVMQQSRMNTDTEATAQTKALLDWCDTYAPPYRRGCYFMVVRNVYGPALAHLTEAESLLVALPAHLHGSLVKAALSGFVRERVSDDVQAHRISLLEGCRAFSDATLRRACMRTIVTGIWEASEPGAEAENGLAFCRTSHLHAAEREACYGNLAEKLSHIYSVPRMDAVCDTFPADQRARCRVSAETLGQE